MDIVEFPGPLVESLIQVLLPQEGSPLANTLEMFVVAGASALGTTRASLLADPTTWNALLLSVADRLEARAALPVSESQDDDGATYFLWALLLRWKVLGDEDAVTWSHYNTLFDAFKHERLWRKIVNASLTRLGEFHPLSVHWLNLLARDLSFQGQYEEAESLFRRILHTRRTLYGNNSYAAAESLVDLSCILQATGNRVELETIYQELVAIETVLGGENSAILSSRLERLGWLLAETHRDNEAEICLRKALDICKKVMGDQHVAVTTSYARLAEFLASQGRYTEAEAYGRLVFQRWVDAHFPENHMRRKAATSWLYYHELALKEKILYPALVPSDLLQQARALVGEAPSPQ